MRRLELAVPIRIDPTSGEVAEAIADALARSPRFVIESGGLTVQIDATPASGRVCLLGIGGSTLACAEAESNSDDDIDTLAQRCVDVFHREAFAPRIDLTQADLHSLDGTPHQDRGGFRF